MSHRCSAPAQPLPQPVIAPFAIHRFRFNFRRLDTNRLSEYTTFAWRGAIGWALSEAACNCVDQCTGQCPYGRLFAPVPPPESSRLRGYTAAPRPFALHALPGSDRSGEYALGLTLAGDAIGHFKELAFATAMAGARGIGTQHAKFSLTHIEQETALGSGQWKTIFAPRMNGGCFDTPRAVVPAPESPRIKVRVVTPMRIRRGGRYRLDPGRFTFDDLFSVTLRRISYLGYFYAGHELDEDFRALTAKARAVPLHEVHLKRAKAARYSSRQRRELSMDGLTGSFVVDTESLDGLWPYLWLGQWLHIGKGSAMGLGRYELAPHPTASGAMSRATPMRVVK